jgi:hypothetical protein
MIRTGTIDKAVPDYHPYRVAGDFNKDGVSDIAVVVVKRSGTFHGFGLLVFNGGSKGFTLAFSTLNLDLQEQGLFFGPPANPSGALIMGAFFSDDAQIIKPKGATYEVVAF